MLSYAFGGGFGPFGGEDMEERRELCECTADKMMMGPFFEKAGQGVGKGCRRGRKRSGRSENTPMPHCSWTRFEP